MIIPLPFFHLLITVLYVLGAVTHWRLSRSPSTAGAMSKYVWVFTLLILALHACIVIRAIATPDGIDVSLGNAISLVAFLCVLVGWAIGLMWALPGFASVILGGAAIAALMPIVLTTGIHRFPYATESWAALHMPIALLAYSLFFVAAVQALIMVGLEKRLHAGVTSNARYTPPLLTLERYLFRLILLGFVLLTLAVISGLFFTEQVFGTPFKLTHKSGFSILAWFIFGTLLVGRWRFGWRGRKALHWILAGTLFLVFAYFGSKLVLE
ncbi:MAG: cytochrome c biogenesis protein CcsA, partial [Burkholderiales bacterium]|nr:cytochrome c biogenesis protein CcsA [Burkholderiales bacterium]